MHHLTSKSADTLSDEYHRLAGDSKSKEARAAFLHAAKLLNNARLNDFWMRAPSHDPLGLRTPREIRLITSSTAH